MAAENKNVAAKGQPEPGICFPGFRVLGLVHPLAGLQPGIGEVS